VAGGRIVREEQPVQRNPSWLSRATGNWAPRSGAIAAATRAMN